MSLCLAGTAAALSLVVPAFTLSWTHSVEKIEWQERWRVDGPSLVLEQSRVRGSGAGMEPPDDARLEQGVWVAPGHLAPLPVLRLAVSGATGSGWQWCAEGFGCHDLERWLTRAGQPPRDIEIRATGPCVALGRREE
jgi:hypothetical protein